MKLIPLKITFLSPFFYFSKITSGGSITDDFVGDIALNYALNSVLKLKNFNTEYKEKPQYNELKDLPFSFTVGKPMQVTRTPIYIRNTLFMDGGPHADTIEQSGRNLFKNYFLVQGLKPCSEFKTHLICKDDFNIKLPLCIRIGTGKECLAKLEKINSEPNDDIWLNYYTLKKIFNLDFPLYPGFNVEYKMNNYLILRDVNEDTLIKIFSGVF